MKISSTSRRATRSVSGPRSVIERSTRSAIAPGATSGSPSPSRARRWYSSTARSTSSRTSSRSPSGRSRRRSIAREHVAADRVVGVVVMPHAPARAHACGAPGACAPPGGGDTAAREVRERRPAERASSDELAVPRRGVDAAIDRETRSPRARTARRSRVDLGASEPLGRRPVEDHVDGHTPRTAASGAASEREQAGDADRSRRSRRRRQYAASTVTARAISIRRAHRRPRRRPAATRPSRGLRTTSSTSLGRTCGCGGGAREARERPRAGAPRQGVRDRHVADAVHDRVDRAAQVRLEPQTEPGRDRGRWPRRRRRAPAASCRRDRRREPERHLAGAAPRWSGDDDRLRSATITGDRVVRGAVSGSRRREPTSESAASTCDELRRPAASAAIVASTPRRSEVVRPAGSSGSKTPSTLRPRSCTAPTNGRVRPGHRSLTTSVSYSSSSASAGSSTIWRTRAPPWSARWRCNCSTQGSGEKTSATVGSFAIAPPTAGRRQRCADPVERLRRGALRRARAGGEGERDVAVGDGCRKQLRLSASTAIVTVNGLVALADAAACPSRRPRARARRRR